MEFSLAKNCEDNTYCLDILLGNVQITEKDLPRISIGDEILSKIANQCVVISGKAPIFIYMFAALRLFQSGARSILIKQAQMDSPLRVFPIENSATATHCRAAISTVRTIGDTAVCDYICHNSTPVAIEALPELTNAVPSPYDGIEILVITGRLPIWLAAAVVISAKQKGWKTIEYLMPRFGGNISLFPELRMGNELPQLQRNGIVIGIVGDPNSGKSVFAELLETSGVCANCDIWRYDCDYAAPTPNWYLDMMKRGREAESKELRSLCKRKWIPGAEQELVCELQNQRKYTSIIIADLPGGRHEKDVAERLPPGREILFGAIDFFIIIAKNTSGVDTGKAWIKELQKIGLDSKIILVFYSECPEQNLSIRHISGGWHISGLNRAHKKAPPDVMALLWEIVSTRLKYFGCPLEIQN